MHLNQTGAFCVELLGLVHDVVLKHKCLHFTSKLIIMLISFFSYQINTVVHLSSPSAYS